MIAWALQIHVTSFVRSNASLYHLCTYLSYFILQNESNDMKVHVLITKINSKSSAITYFYGDFAFALMLSLTFLVFNHMIFIPETT